MEQTPSSNRILPIGNPGDWRRPKREWAVRLGMFALLAALFLPNLGSFGLWDPWETHYGEVSRNMVETHDWVSPYWGYRAKIGPQGRQGKYFYSKPVLIFWMEASACRVIGFSEWAIRLPMALFALFCSFFTYYAVSKLWGRRSGILASLIMATSPQFFLLARQAQTDMVFAAPMTVGLLFLLLMFFGPYEGRISRGSFVAKTLFSLAVFLGSVVPQFGILATDLAVEKNLDGLPAMQRLVETVKNDGVYHAIGYSVLTVILLLWHFSPLLWRWWKKRPIDADVRDAFVRRGYLLIFVTMAGLATLGKGLLGFALPGAVVFVYLLITNQWRLLKLISIPRSLLGFIIVSFPWYVAMFVKHGNAYYTRFFVHDHFNRLGTGVHQIDSGFFDHFLKWLGVGVFPWVAFVPLVLLLAARLRLSDRSHKNQSTLLVFVWAFFAFFLFTVAKTKFHHYIFPALPPVAILIAKSIDDYILGERDFSWTGSKARLVAWVSLGVVLLSGVLLGALTTYVSYAIAIVLTALVAMVALWKHKGPGDEVVTLPGSQLPAPVEDSAARESKDDNKTATLRRLMIQRITAVVSLGLFAAVSVNLYQDPQLFRKLFTYKYDRPMPKHLPYDADAPTSDEAVVACDDSTDCLLGKECRGEEVCQEKTVCDDKNVCTQKEECDTKGTCDHTWGSSRFYAGATDSVRWALNQEAFRYKPFILFVGIFGFLGLALLLFRRMRGVAIIMLLVLGATQTAWGLSVYLPSLSPHWSQKYVFESYYALCGDDLKETEKDSYRSWIQMAGFDGLTEYFHATHKRVCPYNITSWLIVWRGETYYSYNELMPLEKKNVQLRPYMEDINPVNMTLPEECPNTQIQCPRKFFVFMENRSSNSSSSVASGVNGESKKIGRDRNSPAYDAYSGVKTWNARRVDFENDFFTLFEVTPEYKNPDESCGCAGAKFP